MMTRARLVCTVLTMLVCAACTPTGEAPTSGATVTAPTATSAPTSSPIPTPVPTSSLADAPGWVAFQTCLLCASILEDRIHLVRPDGTDLTPILTDLPGRKAHPDFSPDGTQIAFDNLASDDGTDQTYVANADGSNPVLVGRCDYPPCIQTWQPAWSPDGQRLAVAILSGEFESGVGIIDVATGEVTQLFSNGPEDGEVQFPRWSPDGTRLVFWRERDSLGAIFVMDAAPGQPTQLTDFAIDARDPDWSPDGSTIVYASAPDAPGSGRTQLYFMDPDGSNIRPVRQDAPDGSRAGQPRWSPDGRAILYTHEVDLVSSRQIWSINADGTANAPLVSMFATHGTLQPSP